MQPKRIQSKPSPSVPNRISRRVQAAAILLGAKVAADKYRRDLRRILASLHVHMLEGMKEHHPGWGWRQDAHTKWAKKLSELSDQIQALRGPTGKVFDNMAAKVGEAHYKAAKKLLGVSPSGTGIPEKIAEFRDRNIRLVEDAGKDYAQDVREIFEDPDNFGLRPEVLQSKLVERGRVSESRAELIARDQTLKLNGQLNQLRQTNAGIERYVWSTSHDERVRPEHAELDGKVFAWSDPPEPGHPGEDFQCRCVALPIINVESSNE